MGAVVEVVEVVVVVVDDDVLVLLPPPPPPPPSVLSLRMALRAPSRLSRMLVPPQCSGAS